MHASPRGQRECFSLTHKLCFSRFTGQSSRWESGPFQITLFHFLSGGPEDWHIYEATEVVLMCNQCWEISCGMVSLIKCIQMHNDDDINRSQCIDGALPMSGGQCFLRCFFTSESRSVARSLPCPHCKQWQACLRWPLTMEKDRPINPCRNWSWTLLPIILDFIHWGHFPEGRELETIKRAP